MFINFLSAPAEPCPPPARAAFGASASEGSCAAAPRCKCKATAPSMRDSSSAYCHASRASVARWRNVRAAGSSFRRAATICAAWATGAGGCCPAAGNRSARRPGINRCAAA
eukprot:13397153-Alexandrium_andersonii.AAC.1